MTYSRGIIAFVCMAGFVSSVAAGDTGVLIGVVLDPVDREPVAFANIVVVGTNKGAMTLEDGSFRIPQLTAGSYEIKVSSRRHAAAVHDVEIFAGQTTTAELVPSNDCADWLEISCCNGGLNFEESAFGPAEGYAPSEDVWREVGEPWFRTHSKGHALGRNSMSITLNDVAVELVRVDRYQKGLDYFDELEVRRDGETVHQFESNQGAPYDAPKVFVAWRRTWFLEYHDDIIVDGTSLCEREGYDKCFDLRIVDKKPFYFFEHNGSIGMYYGGSRRCKAYDRVLHYMPGSYYGFNVKHWEHGITFWAEKDGVWYYVEAGVPEEPRHN